MKMYRLTSIVSDLGEHRASRVAVMQHELVGVGGALVDVRVGQLTDQVVG